MKKIMFNDRFGLTQAVLDGRKTMTRRFFKGLSINYDRSRFGSLSEGYNMMCSGHVIFRINETLYRSLYKIGEVVAISQRYTDIEWRNNPYCEIPDLSSDGELYKSKGWKNKMYVKAELMPVRICITGIRVEHIQYISDDDCLREGIVKACGLYGCEGVCERGDQLFFSNPREAFAALIKKMAGKKAWDDNPWVFGYEFELIR